MKGFIKRDSMVPTHSDTKDLKPTCIHRMGTSCLRSKCLGAGCHLGVIGNEMSRDELSVDHLTWCRNDM